MALTSVSPEAVVDTARGYLGYPYVYGGKGGYGFDCSSFVQIVYAKHGYYLPRTSRLQAEVGTPVEWDTLQAGDILLFSAEPGSMSISHVGIAVDAERMIHASTGRGEVVVDPLDMRYYRLRRVQARRILGQHTDLGPPGSRGKGTAQHVVPMAPTVSSVPRPSLSHRGPLSLTRVRTAVGVRTMAASVEGKTLVAVVPRLSIRHEALDVEGVLQAPFAASVQPWQPTWRYDTAYDYLRLLDRVRIGSPEGDLYLEASRSMSLTLGNGFIVNGETPASNLPSLVGLAAHAPFSAAARVVLDGWEAHFVLDDVVSPALLGATVGFGRSPGVHITAAIDPQAPSSQGPRARWIGAAELHWPLLDRDGWLVSADVGAAVADAGQPALGGQAGGWLKLRAGAVEWAMHAALRLHDPGFVPGLFGVDYRRLRIRGVAGTPLWDDLDRLALASPWRWGWNVATRLTVTRRFGLRLAYADDVPLARRGDHIQMASFEVSVMARDLELPAIHGRLSGYVTYHQRLVDTFRLPLGTDNEREILFAGARYAPSEVASFGFQLAKRPRGDAVYYEGMIDAIVELPL